MRGDGRVGGTNRLGAWGIDRINPYFLRRGALTEQDALRTDLNHISIAQQQFDARLKLLAVDHCTQRRATIDHYVPAAVPTNGGVLHRDIRVPIERHITPLIAPQNADRPGENEVFTLIAAGEDLDPCLFEQFVHQPDEEPGQRANDGETD